ncbi:hypothetical protein [Nesterenkonia sp. HG001]|uniref:hypothetical protein n=1 Tax=Nesterenkonia sp. HG001 TaxID=2983207 RepID=UPI002AC5EE19|nr:hypothetical protein [Nesterenkonia sp. HG001]MDZ5076952.1 hypothetical protein [Nesterenkonia sp. HG001]
MTTVEGEGREGREGQEDDAEESASEDVPPPSAVVTHEPTESPEEARAYWTARRRRDARPRELRREPPPGES